MVNSSWQSSVATFDHDGDQYKLAQRVPTATERVVVVGNTNGNTNSTIG